jgi:hypothetical protein
MKSQTQLTKLKFQMRAKGINDLLTRQSINSKLEIGENERDCLLAHGMNDCLTESMMERGDMYQMAICNTTGMVAICNQERDLWMSLAADGPVKFVDNLHGNFNIQKVTKYGRKFSMVQIPYSFKLFIQELQTMNVSMRIITEDNLNQMDTMIYSKKVQMNLSGLVSAKKVNEKEGEKKGFDLDERNDIGENETNENENDEEKEESEEEKEEEAEEESEEEKEEESEEADENNSPDDSVSAPPEFQLDDQVYLHDDKTLTKWKIKNQGPEFYILHKVYHDNSEPKSNADIQIVEKKDFILVSEYKPPEQSTITAAAPVAVSANPEPSSKPNEKMEQNPNEKKSEKTNSAIHFAPVIHVYSNGEIKSSVGNVEPSTTSKTTTIVSPELVKTSPIPISVPPLATSIPPPPPPPKHSVSPSSSPASSHSSLSSSSSSKKKKSSKKVDFSLPKIIKKH